MVGSEGPDLLPQDPQKSEKVRRSKLNIQQIQIVMPSPPWHAYCKHIISEEYDNSIVEVICLRNS